MWQTVAQGTRYLPAMFDNQKQYWEPPRRQSSMEEAEANAARPDGEHYREIARKLRELAREFRFPGARRELVDLAERYERRADSLDARSAASSDQDHH